VTMNEPADLEIAGAAQERSETVAGRR
jgi:hypothetical protein